MTLHRHIPEDQEEIIAALTERYAVQRIRFDTGFGGSGMIQASGRIGRQFFYFRFRHDAASLRLGRADRRGDAGRHRRLRRRALRTLRRGPEDGFERRFAETQLRRNDTMDRHPSLPVWIAGRANVTGNPYAGHLDGEEAAGVFIELMGRLELAGPRPQVRKVFINSWTPPMAPHRIVVRKHCGQRPARRRTHRKA